MKIPEVFSMIQKAHQERRAFLPAALISSWSCNGAEFAAGVLVAKYYGIPVRGELPGWVWKISNNRVDWVPPGLVHDVNYKLSSIDLVLQKDGEVVRNG